MDSLISRMREKMQGFELIHFIAINITLMVFIPLSKPMIMCNDELLLRLRGMKPFLEVFKEYAGILITKGRILSIPVAVPARIFGVIGVEFGLFRILQVLGIIMAIVAFTIFSYKITSNKKFSLFLFVLTVACIPISFEHSLPNTFNLLVSIPLSLTFISMNFFINYLNTERKKDLRISIICYLLAITSYEIFITYSIMFVVLAYAKTCKAKFDIKALINKCKWFVFTGVLFVIIYVICQRITGTDYKGNTMKISNAVDIFTVLKTLVLSSLPGYLLFNNKYRYLKTIFIGTGSLMDNISVQMILIPLFLFVFMISMFKGIKKLNNSGSKIFIIIVGLIYVILPYLPYTISQMYTPEIVNSTNMIMVPGSICGYLAAMFTITFIIWEFISLFDKKWIKIVITAVTCFFVFQIQYLNDVIHTEQLKNYKRLTAMEKVFDTSIIHNLKGVSIFSEDFFKTQNALAISDSYWNDLMQSKGINLQISKYKENEKYTLYCDVNNTMTLVNSEEVWIFTDSRDDFKTQRIVKLNNGDYLVCVLNNGVMDNGFMVYSFNIENAKIISGNIFSQSNK